MFKAGLVNPFLDAAYKFLQTELNMEVTRGQLRLESTKATSGEVNVALGVAGDAEGTVLYSMSEKTAKGIAANLLGEPVPMFNELAESLRWATSSPAKQRQVSRSTAISASLPRPPSSPARAS